MRFQSIGACLTVTVSLLATACSGELDTSGREGSSHAVTGGYAEIDFNSRPGYLPNNVVNLSFDDGPDWNNTARVLDVLRDKNVKATFFINTENWSNLNVDEPMKALVRRMVAEGHELASHSVHHLHMATLGADQIEAELRGVEDTVNSVIGPGAPRMTLFRAPFGEPYQGNDPNWPSAAYNLVAPIVARHAVHIGWAIDSFDYNCAPGDGNCVFNNVKNRIQTPGNGDYGVILFHSVHSQTAAALPQIIDYIRSSGFQIWSTEDVVRARFGMTSEQIVDSGGEDPGDGDGSGDDGSGDDGSGDDGSGDDGSGDDGSGDDGGDGDGGDCSAPGFVAGAPYNPGDRVQAGGNLYECKPWPFSGWCSVGGAFAPGSGWAWDQAWTLIGDCSGGGDDGGGDDGGDDSSGDDGGDDSSDDGGDDSSGDDGSDDGGDGDWSQARQARLTYFTSYPDPGSEECIEFNGCQWSGYFAAYPDRKSEEWVSQHNIAAVHERDFDQYVWKTLRIRYGDHEIDAQVVDMCSDADCNGCCTRNAASTGFLIDLESYTSERFGVWDAEPVDWICLDC
jgi:peptidoglycan/xylan/chitin deacetylase (PgdA/CDA1 family)